MRRLFTLLMVALVALFTACEEPEGVTITNTMGGGDWRDEIIYQALIDRFHDGDPNNNFNVNLQNPGGYHGGDWQGLIDKLGYLEELGVTTIWISPVVLNVEQDADFASYHGYWAQHLTKVNPHFGDLNKLRELVKEAHKRDMKVIMDIVANHMGQLFYYDVDNNFTARNFAIGTGVDPYQNWYGDDDCRNNYTCKDGFSCNPDDGFCYNRHMEISEYDPAFNPFGVQGFSALGQNGVAPTYFFDMPEINRLPGEPRNMDLDGDGTVGSVTNPAYIGKISEQDEILGFANMDWYHKKGRVTHWATGDWDQAHKGFNQCNKENRTVNFPNYGITNKSAEHCTNWQTAVVASDQFKGNQVVLGDFPGGLKDLATEKTAVRRALIEVFQYWIRETDIDGFRIDTVKHVEHSFWQEFGPAMRSYAKKIGKDKFFMFGEVFGSAGPATGVYTKGNSLDSVFYFPQKYVIADVVKNGAGTVNLESLYTQRFLDYCSPFENTCQNTLDEHNDVYPSQLLVNFLDNHDVPRFLNHNVNTENPQPVPIKHLHNALMYLLTIDGIPCIYYGTEQNFDGSNDPRNREDLWKSGYDTSNSTFKLIATLNKIRQAYPALRRGRYSIVWSQPKGGTGVFAFKRIIPQGKPDAGQGALVVINFSDSQQNANGINLEGLSSSLENVFPDADGNDTTSGDVTIPARSIKIFVPSDQKRQVNTPYNDNSPQNQYDSSKI